MTVIQELTEIINLLEAGMPADINSPQSQKLEAALRIKLSKYFRALATAFPYSSIDKVYTRNVKESAESEADDVVEPLLRFFTKDLSKILVDGVTEAYLQGAVEMMTYGQTKLGIPIQFEGPPIDEAIAYAKDHVTKAKLVDGINQTTRKQVSRVISDGIKNKRGIPGIKSDLRHKLDWMARGTPSDIKGQTLASRAQMIARTETNDALSQASMDKMRDMGIDGKEWLTGDPCEICAACEAEGVVPREFEYIHNGDDPTRPPAHPNCNCSLAPAIIKK